METVVTFVFLFLFFCVAIAPVVSSFLDGRKVQESRKWSSARGKVIRSEVIDNSDGETIDFYPEITYEYEVDGVRYESSRFDFQSLRPTSPGSEYAENLTRNYYPDLEVTVYFDPANPSKSVLSRNAGSSPMGCLIAVNIVFFLFVLIVVLSSTLAGQD